MFFSAALALSLLLGIDFLLLLLLETVDVAFDDSSEGLNLERRERKDTC